MILLSILAIVTTVIISLQTNLTSRVFKSSFREEESEKTSEAIGYGAVKYADWKINRLTNYTFNFDQMLNDKENTVVYLQYAHARICSIIKKSGKKNIEELKRNGSLVLDHENERTLPFHLLEFTEDSTSVGYNWTPTAGISFSPSNDKIIVSAGLIVMYPICWNLTSSNWSYALSRPKRHHNSDSRTLHQWPVLSYDCQSLKHHCSIKTKTCNVQSHICDPAKIKPNHDSQYPKTKEKKSKGDVACGSHQVVVLVSKAAFQFIQGTKPSVYKVPVILKIQDMMKYHGKLDGIADKLCTPNINGINNETDLPDEKTTDRSVLQLNSTTTQSNKTLRRD
ncbi:hypothetical protein KIW84_072325 [Lathyrus oleraceus]|uniref:arginine--tRNA ligase n=1 Tax=Pisum sativum TaxID=3888 RepID=A0A9D4VN63_PEA|nr:hypothetical protein KIW84_072325 [Pisum sativum]